jgi:two-component system sensor histidine kinase CssS
MLILMHLIMQSTARSDLKDAMLPVETLARQELTNSIRTLTETRLENTAVRLTRAVQSSKLTGARLLIYNGRDNLAYPRTLPNGFVTDSLSRKVSARLKDTNFADRVEQIKNENTTYLFSAYVLSGAVGNHIIIVLVSQQGASNPLIGTINMILVIIMLAGIGIGIFVACRISGRMSSHVGQISKTAEQIGKGNFTHPKWKSTDILEFKQLSQSIAHMSDRLEAPDRSQRTFLQNASHELRTPLMSIQGYAEGISNGIVPDAHETAKIIESESRRLNTLVEELLTLSRIESGTFERKFAPMNLCELLPEFVQRLGGIAIKQQKKIMLTLPPYPVNIQGDEELLGQAMTNIVSNCLRYAKAEIQVSLLMKDHSIMIRIHDDGPGIPTEDLPHLFERFYKGKGGNFGLGLAIAKSAVQYIGGDITAYNYDKGAIFDIILKALKAKK